MTDYDELPKGGDDALVEGYEVSESTEQAEAEMLALAAHKAEGDHIDNLVQPLAELEPKNFERKELRARLRALAASAEGLPEFDKAMLMSEVAMQLRRLDVMRASDLIKTAFHKAKPDSEEESGPVLSIEATEPHAEPVDGAELLDAIEAVFRKYVILPDGAYETTPLWLVHTYLIPVLEVTPRLTARSPMKRCGKTTLLMLLQELAEKPLFCSGLSGASLFRTMESFRPTIIADEADTWIRDDEDIRQVMNAGFYRRSAGIIRCVGEDHQAKVFNSFGAVAIALIGNAPSTIHDRSITFTMRRRMPNESVKRLRLDRIHLETGILKQKIARWAADHLENFTELDPPVPDALHDRAADCWRPLLAIADLAGGEWPEKGRRAALVLSGASESDDKETGTMLLSDVRDIFEMLGVDRIASATLREELIRLEERPWASFGRNEKEITSNTLGKLIGSFGIQSKTMKISDDFGNKQPKRGYEKAAFEDAWSRYISSVTPPQGGDCPVTVLPSSNGAGLRPKRSCYLESEVTGAKNERTAWLSQGNRVTAQQGGEGQEKGSDQGVTPSADSQKVRRLV